MIVLDASVVLNWIFDDEPGGDSAARLKNAHIAGHEIVAVPDLIFYEIGNVLATKARLSRSLKCIFVTADKKLYEKVRSIRDVKLL